MNTQAILHFKKTDPVLAALAERFTPSAWRRPIDNRFEYLALTILYQQLAGKAADAIAKRFRALYRTKHFPTPKRILNTPDEVLRLTGISRSKIRYIKDLALKVHSKEIDIENLDALEDEAVITELTKVTGIGRWTAEMFLMSALTRPDVFPFGDLGLQTAIKKAYRLRTLPSKQKLTQLSKKWSPYRTHAARVLWASLDDVPK